MKSDMGLVSFSIGTVILGLIYTVFAIQELPKYSSVIAAFAMFFASIIVLLLGILCSRKTN